MTILEADYHRSFVILDLTSLSLSSILCKSSIISTSQNYAHVQGKNHHTFCMLAWEKMHVLQPWYLTTLNCVFLHSLLCSLWWFSNCHIFRPLAAWEEPWRNRQQSLNIHSIIFRQSQASSEEAYAGQYWVYMFPLYYLWESVHPIPQLLMFTTMMVSLFHYGLLSFFHANSQTSL